jgi:hypothetical protein
MLSRDLQIKLLISMGVPSSYFSFFRLPFFYDPNLFGIEGSGLKEGWYSNGQPMGLFVSFPMFELAHYVILKFATATTDAEFRICGDDVVVACKQSDAPEIFTRYKNLIERFGGCISESKTVQSRIFAEGVGAIFLKGIQKEVRIPSGKISTLEAHTSGTWISQQIRTCSPVGRALLSSWLSTNEIKEYSLEHRRAENEKLVILDLDDWRRDALATLADHESYPQWWYAWEDPPPGTSVMNARFPGEEIPAEASWLTPFKEEPQRFRWITMRRYRDSLVSHKIISLYKKEKGHKDETQ